MADRVGTEIAGYRIESLLARGGMGEVYLATQTFPERKVALKLLPHQLATDTAFRERFIRESNAAASVEHPNIVPIYGAGEADGELYIAMRFVDGEDLRALLDREGSLPSERAVRICSQIADALQEAHDHGLVHRDVKPGNILISKGDRAYLTDFGLIQRSKLETDLTKTGQFMGTVDYVAPEQIKGEEVDGRADTYSLGCVFYECLTGERPFRRESDVATLYAHLEDPPLKPSVKRPELPPGFDEVVGKATAKERDDRYTFAADFGRGLGVASGGHPLLEPSTMHGRRGRRWVVAAGGLLSLAVLATGLMLATHSSPPPKALPATPIGVSRIDASSDQVTLSVHDVRWGWHMVAAEGALWETGFDGLVKRDESTGRVEKLFDLGGETHVVAAGFGAIWVTVVPSGAEASLVRIDPATDETSGRLDVSPSRNGGNGIVFVATDHESVWVLNLEGTLWKIDPVTTRITKRYAVTGTGSFLTTGGGFVWVSNSLNNEVLRVDPATGKTWTIQMQSRPDELAFVGGTLWVMDVNAGTVTPVYASTLQRGPPIGAPTNPTIETGGLGYLWIAADGLVSRIDPVTEAPLEIPVGFGASTVALDDRTGNIWVLHRPDGWAPPGAD